ncbi:MAG: VWA domain-containing protein [Gammaproteobacteria bacterium]|nr:VWA domain-containing protein [Gammaproteobacteria bacterium]
MKLNRRENEATSIAFLDVITCGFGAIILLLMIAKFGDPPEPEAPDDPRISEISALQRSLFKMQSRAREVETAIVSKDQQLAVWKSESVRLDKELTAARNRGKSIQDTAAANAAILGELKIARQKLTEEMRRLYQQRDRVRTDLVGGIPIDSEYIIFIIDTSGSMFRYAWPKVIEQFVETLTVYPKLKGIQIMNDMGAYMFSSYRGQWIPDTPGRRQAIIDRLRTWNAFSNSSPVEGITAAIRSFYSVDKKISIYVYGDEFTGRSIREVVQYMETINRKDAQGNPLVRIHAIGFPVQFANPPHLQGTGIRFATLMRELTRRNGGTFVGLNSFR